MRHIRSFARRDSRITSSQQQALEKYSPVFQLSLEKKLSDFSPCYIEIGFGSGYSLVAAAKEHPEYTFIGIETFKPGIGALLQQVSALELTNVRFYYGDAVEILQKCISEESLDGINIFFPDPWPKRRHQKRRLIQADFVRLAATKLKQNGCIHLATDWEDYAIQMMRVLSAEPLLYNVAGLHQFAERSLFRPIITKFEGRGEREGRPIWDLQFRKN